jgi:hypothetical protein
MLCSGRKISESTKDVEEDTECIKKNMVRSKTVTGINSIAESEKRADKNNELKLERTSIQGIVNYDSSESSDVE